MGWGMAVGAVPPALMLVSAGLPHCTDCLYAAPRWYMVTLPCALFAAVGFFALPAMQVLLLQDFKDMSGLAGGLSKLVMTLTSTGIGLGLGLRLALTLILALTLALTLTLTLTR